MSNVRTREYRYFIGDFETTVYDNQEYTEVWASAVVEMGTEDVNIFHSIDETFEYLKSLNSNIVIYYHNLKFDGAFWLCFLMDKLKFKQAFYQLDDTHYKMYKEKEMLNNTFKYSISEMGQWYSITIKVKGIYIQIFDSLKLLPFSVEKIGDSFKTKHKKLDMEYTGFRYAGCNITEEEKHYIANDVLVVKEALEIMFEEGHKSLTIGSCCLKEFKNIMGQYDFKTFFPDLTKIEIPKELKQENADKFIRKSYKGGWCYLVKGKENKIFKDGTTADVNSLYPSVMSSESGNLYPVGKPTFWVGDIPQEALQPERYYFVRIRTKFKIKQGYLPCIQIKDSLLYKDTDWLTTSDVYDEKLNVYYDKMVNLDGDVEDIKVELTLTMTDYELIKEHYELIDCDVIGGCWYYAIDGIFDDYINKYKAMKLNSTGARKSLAKLFLNNLYGKFASSDDSSFKKAYLKDNGALGYIYCNEHNKQTVSIAVGSAVTSYARNFTIRTAQKNFYGSDKRGFIYADTDSIHCDLQPEEIKGIKVDDKNFLCWKLESCWSDGIFVRQKTYIERVIKEDLKECDPYYNIKCAGMPQNCKDLLNFSLTADINKMTTQQKEFFEKCNADEKEFISQKRTIEDFKIGLVVPSKLRATNVKGGILLIPTTYEMKK